MVGYHCVAHWCRRQAVIALSSGEAEYYSLVTLMSELIGLRSLGEDFNLKYDLGVNIDATAAIGMSGRRWLGKVKHVDTVFLWIQEAIDRHKVAVKKRGTYEMLADLLTKHLTKEKLQTCCAGLGFKFVEGKHELMLTA